MSGAEGGPDVRSRRPLAAIGQAELLWVEGPDAAGFLGGLFSSDIAALGDGDSQRSLLLDAKGRVRHLVRVRRDAPDAFTLVLAEGDGEGMLADLERYHFSEELDLLGPEQVDTVVLGREGAASMQADAELEVVGWIPKTTELVLADPSAALAAAGLEPTSPEVLDAVRIETGTPLPRRDFGETALVQELGLERSAVSFSKGCYLGQETVARVEHRGNVKRRLRAVLLEDAAHEGAPIVHDGSEVGELGTVGRLASGDFAALAIVRTSAGPGAVVEIAGRAGRVAALPLVTSEAPS